jgi:predicted acetyltransferase
MTIDVREVGLDRLEEFLTPIATAAGFGLTPEGLKAWEEIPEFDLRVVALDGDAVVGGAGSFTYDMTTPGGSVAMAGLTMVAVLPTHRRRGVLTQMMRRYLDVAREREQPVSALWASEGHIYRRFGYGVAALAGEIDVEREHAIFADGVAPSLSARIVAKDEALRRFPEVWERARAGTPGMLSRSEGWWRHRRLGDEEWQRRGRGTLQRVLFERDDRAEGYALYRHAQSWENFASTGSLDVVEAVGGSWEGTRELWRYLLDVDWVAHIKASLLPVDHPLLLLMAEPRRLGFRLQDSLWVRLVDVAPALAARTYEADGSLVFELSDAFCSWNEGRWRLADGRAARTDEEPELRLDATALGAAYLGGFSFSQLHRAGRVEQLRDGALERADALFAADRAPWCPEIF